MLDVAVVAAAAADVGDWHPLVNSLVRRIGQPSPQPHSQQIIERDDEQSPSPGDP